VGVPKKTTRRRLDTEHSRSTTNGETEFNTPFAIFSFTSLGVPTGSNYLLLQVFRKLGSAAAWSPGQQPILSMAFVSTPKFRQLLIA